MSTFEPKAHHTMNGLMNELASVLRGLLKLALLLLTFVLGMAFLFAAIAVVVVSALWSLLRGRKPAIYTTYTQFRQASQAFRQGGAWPGQRPPPVGDPADVVDVQAHEVSDPATKADPRAIERDPPTP
jgi:hypothetical protein